MPAQRRIRGLICFGMLVTSAPSAFAQAESPCGPTATLEARVSMLESLLADRDKEIAQLRAYSEPLASEVATARARVAAIEQELAGERRLRTEEANRARRELAEARFALQQEIAARHRAVGVDVKQKELTDEVGALRSRLNEVEETLAAERKARASVEADAARLRQEVAGREAAAASACSDPDRDAMVAREGEMRQTLEERQQEVSRLSREIRERDAELERLREKSHLLEARAAESPSETQGADRDSAPRQAAARPEPERAELARQLVLSGAAALRLELVAVKKRLDEERRRRESAEAEASALRNRAAARSVAADAPALAPEPIASPSSPDRAGRVKELLATIDQQERDIERLRSSKGGRSRIAALLVAKSETEAELRRVRREVAESTAAR